MDVVAWRVVPAPGFCTLGNLENVPDAHDLAQGRPREAGFPRDAAFHMDPSHPKDKKVGDCLLNLEGLLVVSDRAKTFLEQRHVQDVELLPVTIFDHKKRPLESSFWIVNPLRIIDCIDTSQSTITWNKIDPQSIDSCFGLVLKAADPDPPPPLFRPKHMEVIVLVERTLATALDGKGFAGMHLQELDAFEL